MTSLPPVLLLCVVCMCEGAGKVIDMTHSFGEHTLNWPGMPEFNFTIMNREQQEAYWFESNWFGTSEHGGTHIDSPAHFSKGKWRVHEIPLENLIGPGVVIDVSEKARSNPDYELNVNDILAWEREYGQIPLGAILMMHCGWASNWPNRTLVYGTDTPDNESSFHFPGLDPDAATWLVANRNFNAFGTDGPSVDAGQSTEFQAHITLYENNKVGVENVANLHLVPAQGARIYAMPMKLYNGSGGPVRVFAILEDHNTVVDNIWHYVISAFVVLFAVVYVQYNRT